MLYFQNWSGGKDSTASIILEHIYGLPPSKIIMSEVMFDKKRNISGELPEHMEWVHGTAVPLFQSWGYDVNILHASKDYLDIFFRTLKRSSVKERNGKLVGFVIGGMCEANNALKLNPIKDFYKNIKEDFIQYVGIATDEQKRIERLLNTNKMSLLVKYGYTENMAKELCEDYGLLSPVYKYTKRGGCWFCPNHDIKCFAYIKLNYYELWEELRQLSLTDNLVSQVFRYNKTFAEVDREVDVFLNNLEFEKAQMTLDDYIRKENNKCLIGARGH